MSIEGLREGILSTQSDVWAFGVVLWEIYTLGDNPYSGVEYEDNFLKNLEEGKRLLQPKYATEEM